MGDANKIKQLVSQSSQEYLSKSFDASENTKPYILEDEFAATKKNRSFFVIGVTLLTILAFALTAFFLTRAIERSTENQTVDVSSFEDLNLKDLLDGAKRTEEQFATLNRELGDLERSLDTEIRTLTMSYNSDVELVSVERLSESTRRSRLATLLKKRDNDIAEVKGRYVARIIDKQAALDDAAAALDSYDSRMLDQARKNEEVLASERNLFELEKSKLTTYYEERLETLSREAEADRKRLSVAKEDLLTAMEKTKAEELDESFKRYNPIFDDPALLALLDSLSTEPERREAVIPASLLDRGLDASSQLKDVASSLSALDAISTRLALVPYDNSIPPALAALKNAALSMSLSYASIVDLCANLLIAETQKYKRTETELATARASLSISKREADTYRGALEALGRSSGDAGYVLQVTEDRITLWLDPLASGSTEAWVFRDDMAIAKLRLERDGQLFKGVILERTGKETPRPFDKILVTLATDARPAAVSGGTQ